MKRYFKGILLLLCVVTVFLQPLSVYAWTSAEGESGNLASFKSEYSINPNLQGWLMYWVDDNENVISDVAIVLSASVANQFNTADYKAVTTRFQNWSYSRVIDINTIGIPLPYYNDHLTNAPSVKQWITEHKNALVSNLHAPSEIDTCTEEDKYFFIAEPVYMFPLFSNVEGVPKRTIVGTTYQYANYIKNNLLGTADYPSSATLFGSETSRGLTEHGWWGTCLYTNGLFGTFECVGNDYIQRTTKIGITRSGEDYFNIDFSNHPLSFSTLADKSIGLGIVVMSNSDKGGSPTPTPDLVTHPYVGSANPDTWTYNYASQFNLDKNNDPAGRIPSGEMLTNGINVDKWYCDYSLIKHEPSKTGDSNLRKRVSVQYNIHWTVINSYKSTDTDLSESEADALMSRSDVHNPSKSQTHTKDPLDPTDYDKYSVSYYGESERVQGYTTYVTRETYYYELENFNIYTFNKAVITCENTSGVTAYTGNQIIYNGDYNVSYTNKKTAKVVHTPTNRYNVDLYADNYDDGKQKAEARKSSDADDFIVQNDYFEAGGKVFLPNSQGQHGADFTRVNSYNFPDTGVGNYETAVTIPFTCPNDYYYTSAVYTYKSVLDPTKGVTIQKNAWETHSAHRASIDERIQNGYRQNEPVFVHTPVVNNVDTSGSGEVQLVASKVNDLLVDYQLRLDNTYTFEFDIEKHLNLLGYSLNGYEWDYAKYVKKAQVLFPFDVAIVSNPLGEDVYTYYKANTWIDVDYLVPTTYYIPSWAKETDYGEIYFRTIAYNIDSALSEEEYTALEQEVHNLVPSNYVAYTKIAVQLSGYIYDLKVTGSNESIQLTDTDEFKDVSFAKEKHEYRAGDKNRLGTNQVRFEKDSLLTGSWDTKYTLPFANGSASYNDCAGTLGKGTQIGFSVKTIANCWNEDDELVIIPRLRYVSSDGTQYDYDDTRIYYFTPEDYFVEVGSERDKAVDINESIMGLNTSLYSGLFTDSWKEDRVARTLGIFNRVNGTNYDTSYTVMPSGSIRYRGVWNVLSNNGKGTGNYLNVGLITIPNTLKLYTGDEEDLSYNYNREGVNVIRLDDTTRQVNVGNSSYATITSSNGNQVAENTKELMYASMQTWYGEWVLPPKLFIAFTSDVEQYGDVNYDGVVDLMDYMEYDYAHSDGLTTDEDIWIKDGYLVLNFEIYVRKNGEDHLTYYSNTDTFNRGAETVHGQNMMRVENAKASFNQIVRVGGEANVPVTLQTGDIAIFDMLHSTQDYFSVGVGWTN